MEKHSYISKRYSSKTSQSFLPDMITIPDIGLHPFLQNKDQHKVQLDLGCYRPCQRLQIFLYIMNIFPVYFSEL